MRTGIGAPSVRVVAPAILVVGVLGATFFFLRGQPAGGGSAVVPADADLPSARARVGAATGDVAQRFKAQVEALQAQLEATPSDRDLVLRLAQLLHDGHQIPEALPLYRRAMAMEPTDPQPFYDLASAYGTLGEWDAAAGVLQERLSQDPGDAVALYDLGAVRANQGRTEEATRLLVQARNATSDGATLSRISQALARLKGS